MKRITKSIAILSLSLTVLVGCGSPVDFKSDEDREDFTHAEIEAVEQGIQSLKGVESFSIQRVEGGVYAELIVEDRKNAKKLADEAFQAMWVESNRMVDLFVKESGKEDILIQAFKPTRTDKENKWDILY